MIWRVQTFVWVGDWPSISRAKTTHWWVYFPSITNHPRAYTPTTSLLGFSGSGSLWTCPNQLRAGTRYHTSKDTPNTPEPIDLFNPASLTPVDPALLILSQRNHCDGASPHSPPLRSDPSSLPVPTTLVWRSPTSWVNCKKNIFSKTVVSWLLAFTNMNTY